MGGFIERKEGALFWECVLFSVYVSCFYCLAISLRSSFRRQSGLRDEMLW